MDESMTANVCLLVTAAFLLCASLGRQRQSQPPAKPPSAETAYLLGHEDPNSFFRAFREWESTTPSE